MQTARAEFYYYIQLCIRVAKPGPSVRDIVDSQLGLYCLSAQLLCGISPTTCSLPTQNCSSGGFCRRGVQLATSCMGSLDL